LDLFSRLFKDAGEQNIKKKADNVINPHVYCNEMVKV